MTTSASAPVASPDLRSAIARRMLQIIIQAAIIAGIGLIAAGTVRWWNMWVFTGLFFALVLANACYAMPRNRELIAERGRRHRGTKSFDTLLMGTYTVIYLGLFALAGLDSGRYGWARLSWPWALLGGVALVVSTIPIATALASNPHLETTARIQSERGHHVVTTGPYRYVRHPMYTGMLVQLPATALLLGSAWALVPAAVCAVLIVARTALEDRMLRWELPGYRHYAEHTRYRLIPRVW